MLPLDKSLDEIISSKKPLNMFRKKNRRSGKRVESFSKKKVNQIKKVSHLNKIKSNKDSIDLTYATKVVVYGLPKDLKQESIKVSFDRNTSRNYDLNERRCH